MGGPNIYFAGEEVLGRGTIGTRNISTYVHTHTLSYAQRPGCYPPYGYSTDIKAIFAQTSNWVNHLLLVR